MEAITFLLGTIVLLRYIFKIDFKKAKELNSNKELEELTNKFPENIDIAKEMLEMLDNKKVKVEQAKNTETSLYIAVTNKISIADMKNNYARIQTIAHECMHSVQNRRLLLCNFIFSNINIIYIIAISILTHIGKIQNTMLQLFILSLFLIIRFAVRSFLEIDAMTKARYFAEKYIRSKKILTDDETEKLLKEYDKINEQGVPFMTVYILISSLLWLLGYAFISVI